MNTPTISMRFCRCKSVNQFSMRTATPSSSILTSFVTSRISRNENIFTNNKNSLMLKFCISKRKYAMVISQECSEGSNSSSQTSSLKHPWLHRTSGSFWSDLENQRQYMDWLGETLGYKSRKDWYGVTRNHFAMHSGMSFLGVYGDSIYKLLRSVYTDYEYLPWLFSRVPKNYFNLKENRERYVYWLLNVSGVKTTNELTSKHFVENHGAGLLRKFGHSPTKVINSLLNKDDSDQGNALPRKRAPNKFWVSSIENQRNFLDSIGKKIGVKDNNDLSPWYEVGFYSIRRLGAAGLLARYDGSIYAMLSNIYPKYDWVPWRFNRIPKGLSQNPESIEKALQFVEKELSFHGAEDWYRVSSTKLRQLGVNHFFIQNGGHCESAKNV